MAICRMDAKAKIVHAANSPQPHIHRDAVGALLGSFDRRSMVTRAMLPAKSGGSQHRWDDLAVRCDGLG